MWDFAWSMSGFNHNTTQNNASMNLDISAKGKLSDNTILSNISLTFSPKHDDSDPTDVEGQPDAESKPPSPLYMTPPSKVPTSRKNTMSLLMKGAELKDISPVRTKLKRGRGGRGLWPLKKSDGGGGHIIFAPTPEFSKKLTKFS